MAVVDGWDWMHGATVWRVTYEDADADGGGYQVDYFQTANRFTPPTGPQIRACLDGDDLTVIGVEAIEWVTTDTPDGPPAREEALPDDSAHRALFDLTGPRGACSRRTAGGAGTTPPRPPLPRRAPLHDRPD